MAHLLTLPGRIGYDWFDQRQRELVELAGTWWGREYLHLPAECGGLPIVALWPNAVHAALPDGQRRAVFYARPIFAERIRRFAAWEQRYGTLGATLRASDPRLQMVELAVANSSTFNPDADVESTSVDGHVYQNNASDATWANIRAGAGTTAVDSGVWAYVGIYACHATTENHYRFLGRGIFLFDTHSLGGGVVTAATFSLYHYVITNNPLDNGNQSIALTTSSPASNTALIAADYAQLGSVRQCDTDIDITAWSTVAYNDWVLNALGRGSIAVTGVTKLGTRLSGDIDNVAPAWSADQVGQLITSAADNGSNKPKLVVNYYPISPLILDSFI